MKRHSQSLFDPGTFRTRLLASAVRQLAAIGRVAPVQVTFRTDYSSAAIDGGTAAEMTGKAAEESAALCAYIADTLEIAPDGSKAA